VAWRSSVAARLADEHDERPFAGGTGIERRPELRQLLLAPDERPSLSGPTAPAAMAAGAHHPAAARRL
jgi:hypothetical protein